MTLMAQTAIRLRAYNSLSVFLFLSILMINSTLWAQQTTTWSVSDIVAKAKRGQWVELEGIVQEDMSVVTTEIEFLTGDFMDDDWELKGKVNGVTPEKNQFEVLSIPVKADKNTSFEDDLEGVHDIRAEMWVELEGTYLEDGVFLAKEVEDATEKRKNTKSNTIIEAMGRVGQVDAEKYRITVMGISFRITEKTKGKSLIK